MPNIAIRKSTPSALPVEWDPFQAMRDMLRWDPFQEMAVLPDIATRIAAFNPAFEVKETKEGYVFKADVPGVAEKDLDITLQANRLTVTGKRESEETKKEDTYYAYERTYGSFTRSFTLPEGADAEHVKAELKEGVLTLQIPKTAEAQPKKITFKVGKA